MDINWFAVGAAALASFVLGGLWYSPVMFVKPWRRLSGVTEEQAKSNFAVILVAAFVLAFIAAAMFAVFLGKQTPLVATGYGFSAGLCWVATSFGINYLFERRPLGLFLINGGYHTVQFTLIGLILGLWH